MAFTIAHGNRRRVLSLSLGGLVRRLSPRHFFHTGHRILIYVSTVSRTRPFFGKGVIMAIHPPCGRGVAVDRRGLSTFGL